MAFSSLSGRKPPFFKPAYGFSGHEQKNDAVGHGLSGWVDGVSASRKLIVRGIRPAIFQPRTNDAIAGGIDPRVWAVLGPGNAKASQASYTHFGDASRLIHQEL